MQIPQVGRDVLFILSPADDAEKKPAIVRPGKIVSVLSYSPEGARCNLSVLIDPTTNDRRTLDLIGKAIPVRINDDSTMAFVQDAEYNTQQNQFGTWCYTDDVLTDERIESVIVEHEITHGREKIRAGAIGTWDESKNLITFRDNDVTGPYTDAPTTYPANTFIDTHIARLQFPEGFITVLRKVAVDGSETPEERKMVIGDIMRMMNDRRYYINRMNGMPAPAAASILKAREEALTLVDNTGDTGDQGKSAREPLSLTTGGERKSDQQKSLTSV